MKFEDSAIREAIRSAPPAWKPAPDHPRRRGFKPESTGTAAG